MDNSILLFSLLTFVMYCISQILVFRFIRPERALMWLIKLFFIIEGVALILGYWLIPYPLFIPVSIWQCSIFTVITVIYIGSVFSFTEASITLRILHEIALHPRTGVEVKEIWKRYNTKTIIEKRMTRFLAGGDIRKEGNAYIWISRTSPFIVRQYVVSFVSLLFGSHKL